MTAATRRTVHAGATGIRARPGVVVRDTATVLNDDGLSAMLEQIAKHPMLQGRFVDHDFTILTNAYVPHGLGRRWENVMVCVSEGAGAIQLRAIRSNAMVPYDETRFVRLLPNATTRATIYVR